MTGLDQRVTFRAGDLLLPFDTPEFHSKVDLLVCNPPYISSGKVTEMPEEISQHEPSLAFDGGPLGIRILQRLITDAPRFLRGGGWLAFEVGLGQGRGVKRKLEQQPHFSDITEIADPHGDTRALLARRTDVAA
jgi:release factor glutamine methyltransferase